MPYSNLETGPYRSCYLYVHLLYSLIFIMGHILGGRVPVTDGDYRFYYNYEHVITQQYISDMDSPICA
jgi:hypothetical protein